MVKTTLFTVLVIGAACSCPIRVKDGVVPQARAWLEAEKDGREIRIDGLDLTVRQEPYLCWAACLQIAHDAFGIEVSQNQFAEEMLGNPLPPDATIDSWRLFFSAAQRRTTVDCRDVVVCLVVKPELVVGKKSKKGILRRYLKRVLLPRLEAGEPVLIGFRPVDGAAYGHVKLATGARLAKQRLEGAGEHWSHSRVMEVELFDPSTLKRCWTDVLDVTEGSLLFVYLDVATS